MTAAEKKAKEAKELKEAAVETKKIPKGYFKAEAGTYVAKVDCTFGISYFKAGVKKLRTTGGEIIPHHFVLEKVFKKILDDAEAKAAAENEDY